MPGRSLAPTEKGPSGSYPTGQGEEALITRLGSASQLPSLQAWLGAGEETPSARDLNAQSADTEDADMTDHCTR